MPGSSPLALCRAVLVASPALWAPTAVLGMRRDARAGLGSPATTAPSALTEEGQQQELIPDELLYPHGHVGPASLTEDQDRMISERMQRCWAPDAEGSYTAEDKRWKEELDTYMNAQAKRGLRKVSKAIIYDMPHVWGDHFYTKYFPHHWISAIVPDLDAAPSSHCLEFDYATSNPTSTDDPNGCMFFRRSFQPTQRLARCLTRVFEGSTSWKGRQAIMKAGHPVYKADFGLKLVAKSSPDLGGVAMNPLDTWQAIWNDNDDLVPEVFTETKPCTPLVSAYQKTMECSQGTFVRFIEACHVMGHGDAVLECARGTAAADFSMMKHLVGRELVLAGQLCATNHTPELKGHVAVVEGNGCDPAEKAARAVRLGAVAIIFRTLPGTSYYRGGKDDRPGGLPPIPAFALSDATFQTYVQYMKNWESSNELSSGSGVFEVIDFTPKLPNDAELVENFVQEVRIFKNDGACEKTNTRQRVYELIKMVSMEPLNQGSVAGAKFKVARAARRSMTQPEASKYDQIDHDTEDGIFRCYELPVAETTTTTTTTTAEQTAKQKKKNKNKGGKNNKGGKPQPNPKPSAKPSPAADADEKEDEEDVVGVPKEEQEAVIQEGSPEGIPEPEEEPACKSLKVVSAGSRRTYKKEAFDMAEFYLGGEKIDFNAERGINVVTIDPQTQEVTSKASFAVPEATSSFAVAGAKANDDDLARLVDFVGVLPKGTVVLLAVKGTGAHLLPADVRLALGALGARQAARGRLDEGYALIGQKGGRGLAERVDRYVVEEALMPCKDDDSGEVPEEALLNAEASKCLPAMWDKVEVGGQPWPQVTEASGSFPQKKLRVIDNLPVHPVCGRMSVALNAVEMTDAPYPNPDEWELSSKFKMGTGLDAMQKGRPDWIAKHLMDFCFNPDTAVCTSYTVCWALIIRHITKFIHPYCAEDARSFPEMPVNEV